MKFKHLWFLSLFLLLFACNDAKKSSPKEPVTAVPINEISNQDVVDSTNAPSELKGIWILAKLNKTTVKNKTSVKNPTLHINPSEGTVKGNGGCNRYDGRIHFPEEMKIKIDPVKSTKIACEKLELETTYFKSLSEGILTYILKDKELTLYNDNTTLVFEKAD